MARQDSVTITLICIKTVLNNPIEDPAAPSSLDRLQNIK